MIESVFIFIIPAFIAGFLMFLAPCTLPLVPAYLAYIAGIRPGQVIGERVKRRIRINSLYYVLGFSLVFITLGVLAGIAGTLVSAIRQVLLPVAGLLILFFGLQMLHVIRFDLGTRRLKLPLIGKPGSGISAFVIGAAFALGWTPCVGPILATVLLLAGSSGTILSGTVLLFVFSLGLAIPFVLVAFFYASATEFIAEHQAFVRVTEMIGGIFLLLIGALLVTDNFELTIVYGYQFLELIGVGNLLDYY